MTASYYYYSDDFSCSVFSCFGFIPMKLWVTKLTLSPVISAELIAGRGEEEKGKGARHTAATVTNLFFSRIWDYQVVEVLRSP